MDNIFANIRFLIPFLSSVTISDRSSLNTEVLDSPVYQLSYRIDRVKGQRPLQTIGCDTAAPLLFTGTSILHFYSPIEHS